MFLCKSGLRALESNTDVTKLINCEVTVDKIQMRKEKKNKKKTNSSQCYNDHSMYPNMLCKYVSERQSSAHCFFFTSCVSVSGGCNHDKETAKFSW